ncbi:MAG: hypothetical protein QM490_04890 [Candidatus Gracilibacteria bacterium]
MNISEKIVETKICKQCNSSFDITDKDLEFYDKVSPIFNDIKYNIPTPQQCPECRERRRLGFRNERIMYRRNSDFSGKEIISMYSPDKSYKVYTHDEWFSDKWDAMDYGVNFDFSKSFFEQINKLIFEVPLLGLTNSESENSSFNNYIIGVKNCYMSSVVYLDSEDVYYSSWVYTGKDIIDCRSIFDSQVCYESHDCRYCSNCFYVSHSFNSYNCFFSRNLTGCKNCIFCTNLENKEYYIFNKKVSKDEFEIQKNQILTGSYENINNALIEFNKFSISQPFVYANLINCENSTGDNLFNAKNAFMCFDLVDIEDSKFCNAGNTKDSYDGIGGENERCYEFSRVGWAQNVLFTYDGVECNNVILSFGVYNSSNLFGCVGLRNKKYCIFNKQYTKEEYEVLVPKIIEHMQKTNEWGEFFPLNVSPFGYNESVAQEYYPLTKERALISGCNWSDYKAPFPKVKKIIPANKLPDNIKDIPDDILNRAVECEITKKPFRIIKEELDFYRKHNLPIPRKHPNQRHLDRMNKRNPRKLYKRNCYGCNDEINTNYSPERPEKVYCERCYMGKVY